MATILIDKLLQTVINQGASDLHITVGQPPVLRLHGHLRKAGDQGRWSRKTPSR